MKKLQLGTRSVFAIFSLLFIAAILSGCSAATDIVDVKDSGMVGETVTVSGTVRDAIKLGDISGYTLADDTGSISISSRTLPQEGTNVRVTGVVMRDTVFGYYITEDQ